MDIHADKQPPIISGSYAEGRLARAFVTALTHADPATRARAEGRADGWRRVLSGMADGTLRVGSRTPVSGLPAWVTLEVLHGGFATGTPRADGPLLPYEADAAREAGIPEEREALFAHCLTERGLAELWALLDSTRYEVTVPEEAALLTVAWLVRAGEPDAALELVREIRPFAATLRFTPRPSAAPAPDTDAVHRRTVGDAGATLAARGPNAAVETQREALRVWRPFENELLGHWLETAGPDHRVLDREPGTGWHARGVALLDRYRALAREHTLCGRHRDPKGNPGILRGALEETAAGRPLDARRLGLLRHAVTSMVRKRGLPGSERHTAVRSAQAAQAALPSHQDLAHLVAHRMSGLPQDTGAADVTALVAPVTEAEQRRSGLPAGTAVPPAIRRVVEGARSAPLHTLVELGVLPSAEVLAELVPQLVAAETAGAYRDAPLRALAAANYRAFRTRRSVLLLDLKRQVGPEELPWVRAVAAQRSSDAHVRDSAHTTLRRLAEVAVEGFPGTLLPNPLVRELAVLARRTDLDAPLVEELAADIFMGTFSPKFQAAAVVAGELLGGGSLYERYYGIDYAAVRALPDGRSGRGDARRKAPRDAPDFAALCLERAGASPFGGVAENGTVIEQAQILTTHNLATLVHRVGVAPAAGWAELARRCFATVCRLTGRAHHERRPLGTVKDAAYAWRQMLFHLSLCDEAEAAGVLAWTHTEAARHPAHVAARLAPALAGLRLVAEGGSFAADGTADEGRARRLTGWTTTGGHWLSGERTGRGRG
ncbi:MULTISPECIES: hypothetical protein [unclassified Streptomyces]|uniref:hypothetical protein n=1 Tax=unclassified Streptomyces TaxID=2593676 RepID=UPI0006F5A088|nr:MULTISPECIES: hypothetical protein [unclassified Streptomyces]KQX54712.1 hypothetical protein ASD33_32380 [Streptomyces sp. Root1304]KRA93528.1 hypothetical protein ASE09_32165 [Streptomyces sp. Root66D1]